MINIKLIDYNFDNICIFFLLFMLSEIVEVTFVLRFEGLRWIFSGVVLGFYLL